MGDEHDSLEKVESNEGIRCPIGTDCKLTMINYVEVFAECIPVDPKQKCTNALQFGGGNYCRALWKLKFPRVPGL